MLGENCLALMCPPASAALQLTSPGLLTLNIHRPFPALLTDTDGPGDEPQQGVSSLWVGLNKLTMLRWCTGALVSGQATRCHPWELRCG